MESPIGTGACQARLSAPLPKIIPAGGICLLAGQPGVGKSALTATFARHFRDHEPIFGHQPSALPGLGIISADRSWPDSAGYWLDLVGYGDIPHYSMVDDPAFNPKLLRRKFERTDLLFRFADPLQLPRGSLLIVDPISLFLGGKLNEYDDCAVACCEIRDGLRRRGLSILSTAHAGKLKADASERYLRLQDQILGSTALFGFTDSQMYLASPQETGKSTYTFLWAPHTAPTETFDLRRDERGVFSLVDQDQDKVKLLLALFPVDGAEITRKLLIEAWLTTYLTTLNKRTADRLLRKLEELRLVVHTEAFGTYQRAIVH